LLFQPLRSWLQGRVDRLMYGQRRDPYRVLTELGRRLDSTLEPDAVLPAIVETVLGALRLPYVAIELQSGPGVQVIEQAGRPPQDRSTLPAIPLLYQGILIGRLVAAPRSGESELSPDDRRLLQDLALQAGVAVHAVQVTADLRQARRRLIDAREEERGRLRRDLHDGLGARLAGQTLALDAVRSHIERDPEQAIRLVDALRSQAQEALAEIRELIDGLRPAALDDLGLEAALVELAGRLTAGQALHIEVEACLAGIELPPAIESAAYRIAQEALNNVARHSGAAHCRVEICVPFGEPACLRLEVFDDGHGLPADYRPGIGLRSMADRAAAAGGRLQIQAAPGGGVQVLAELPLKPHKELHPAERQP
jgi:signal transduction histidine kinase